MKLIKTFYIGCPDDGIPTDPVRSNVIRYCQHTLAALAPFITKMSHPFLQAELLNEEGISGPFELTILVPISAEYKFKEEDPETILERVLWLIGKMRAPKGGIKISVYVNEYLRGKMDSGWDTHKLWEAKDIWQKDKTENYITVHRPETLAETTWNKRNADECFNMLFSCCRSANFRVVELTYSTPYEEMYQALLKTKMHFSYVGASYFMAALTKTPTLGIGLPENRSCTIADLSVDGAARRVISKNIFMMITADPGHFLKYDNGVVNGVCETVYDTHNPFTVKKEIIKVINESWKES